MNFKEQITHTLRLEKTPSPWPRMILCALSVTLPLVAGIFYGDQHTSVYGALLGFILILNDHFGPFKKRVQHLLTSFFFLSLSFFIGLSISDSTWLIFLLLFIMAFVLGKSKGFGLELERLVLFSTFQLLNAALTPELKSNPFQLMIYATLSLLNYLVCLSMVYLVMKHKPNFQRSKRQELLEAFRKKESHRYALTLAAVSCAGLLIAEVFNLERGQWMVGTILIVMMPSRSLSFQKSFQRIFGTFIGVIIAALVIVMAESPLVLVSFSCLAAFLAPLGLIRNYWLGNVFIAALIMFFLEFASIGIVHNEFQFAIARLIDITLGCLIGSIGTAIAFRK